MYTLHVGSFNVFNGKNYIKRDLPNIAIGADMKQQQADSFDLPTLDHVTPCLRDEKTTQPCSTTH